MLDRALCPSRVCFGLPVEPLGASQLPDLDLHGLAAQAEVLHDVEILRTFLRARDGRVSDEREGLCYMSISSKRPPKVTDRHCIGRYAHDSTQTNLTHISLILLHMTLSSARMQSAKTRSWNRRDWQRDACSAMQTDHGKRLDMTGTSETTTPVPPRTRLSGPDSMRHSSRVPVPQAT